MSSSKGRNRLPIASLSQTLRILKHEARIFAPSLGLVTQLTPQLLANLRCLNIDTTSPQNLASLLFHQRLDKQNCRYGPVAVINSESYAAYWISAADMGHLAGLALSPLALDNKLTDKHINTVLKQMGIESNYYRGQLTGVSLERYRRLVRKITYDYQHSPHAFTIPTISAFVWEKARSKECILQYLLAVEQHSQRQLIDDSFSFLRNTSAPLDSNLQRTAWLESRWKCDNSFDLHAAWELLVKHAETEKRNTSHIISSEQSNLIGFAMEEIIGMVAMRNSALSSKAPYRLGRFAMLDGPVKPDCVEIVIREIIEALVYNEDQQSFDIDKLPQQCNVNLKLILQTSLLKDNLVMTDKSQAWFELCANLPDCLYLSEATPPSPVKVVYELRPTMVNVCRVLGLLLFNNPSWTKLGDLKHHWNQHLLTISQHSQLIEVQQNVLVLRAAYSDTERNLREKGLIILPHRQFALHLDLEDAHGLASVRHCALGGSARDMKLWEEGKDILRKFDCDISSPVQQQVKGGPCSMFLKIMQAAILGDELINTTDKSHQHERKVLHALLSVRCGEERRVGPQLIITPPSSSPATTSNLLPTAAVAPPEVPAVGALDIEHLRVEAETWKRLQITCIEVCRDHQELLLPFVIRHHCTGLSTTYLALALKRIKVKDLHSLEYLLQQRSDQQVIVAMLEPVLQLVKNERKLTWKELLIVWKFKLRSMLL